MLISPSIVSVCRNSSRNLSHHLLCRVRVSNPVTAVPVVGRVSHPASLPSSTGSRITHTYAWQPRHRVPQRTGASARPGGTAGHRGRALSAWVPAPRHGTTCVRCRCRSRRVSCYLLCSPWPRRRRSLGRTTTAFRGQSQSTNSKTRSRFVRYGGLAKRNTEHCSRGEKCPSVGPTCTGGTTCGPRARPRCTWGTRSG